LVGNWVKAVEQQMLLRLMPMRMRSPAHVLSSPALSPTDPDAHVLSSPVLSSTDPEDSLISSPDQVRDLYRGNQVPWSSFRDTVFAFCLFASLNSLDSLLAYGNEIPKKTKYRLLCWTWTKLLGSATLIFELYR
jgi:hypothetical protein